MTEPVDFNAGSDAPSAAHEQHHPARGYLDAVNALIVALDRHGRITLINRFGCALLGYTEAELIGRDWFETCVPRPKGKELVKPVFERLMRGEVAEAAYFENEVLCADGQVRLLAWHNNFLRDDAGDIDGILCAGNDITERRAMEAAKEQALAEGKRLADLKSAFLANMSHEIRTPLSALLGLAQIGVRDHGGHPAGELFGRIEQAGQHLLAVINDILDLSQIETGKLTLAPEPFRLSDQIDETTTLVLAQARGKGLTLTADVAPDVPEWVMGDALRLAQILINLLGNAVKFTERGSVALHVTRADERLLFRVEDTGIGISGDQIAHIFTPFEQADASVTRRYGGSGLGLAISRNLARMMGGDLSVQSQLGAGSQFTLRLPLSPTRPPRQPPEQLGAHTQAKVPIARPTDTADRLAGLRILAVDDLEVNRMILEDLLTHEGALVTAVAGGAQAVAAVVDAAQPFNLVLMDIQMPGMDGFQAARRIIGLRPALPVIGLSAHVVAEECHACVAAGMVGYLNKPLDLDVLVRQLAMLSSTRRTLRCDGGDRTGAEARPTTPAFSPALTPAPPPAPKPASIESIDWDALQARFAASPGFVERLVRTALQSESTAADELRATAAAGDIDAYFRKAHAVKGLAGNLCANPLLSLATTTCRLARVGDSTAFAYAEPLAAALESVLSALARRIEIPDPFRA